MSASSPCRAAALLRGRGDRRAAIRPRALEQCEHSSAGKRLGSGGAKVGNVHLKWAFSEAAALFLRKNPRGQQYVRRLAGKHGKAKALSILAAKLGRAVYHMLRRERSFDPERFFAMS